MRFILLTSIAFALAGCATRQYASDNSVTQLESLSTVPVANGAELFEAAIPYRIGPLDKLRYSVLGIEDMTGEVQVDTGGRISMPLVGSLLVLGRTPQEVEAQAVAALRRNYVRQPVVTINMLEINSQTVTVDGSVREPGVYPLQADMTLLRAIASAKGLSEFGREQNVMVFRAIDGKRYAALYNLEAIRQGAYRDPQLYSGDIVVVDESRSKRVFRDLLTAAPGVLSPLVLLFTR